MRTLLIVALSVSLTLPAAAEQRQNGADCEKVKTSIRRIEAQMRAGYTAKRGVRLADRLRELRARRAKVCR